jgi:cation:H+ antiporter
MTGSGSLPAWADVVVFLASLAATLAAAALFARRLDRLGHRLGIAEPLLGLLTALAADAPELSSGAVAIARGEHGVGVGVLLGSNLFNLAAMVGLTAMVGPRIRLDPRTLGHEGAFALFGIAVSSLVLGRVIPAWLGATLALATAVPYVRWLAGGSARRVVPHPRRWHVRWTLDALTHGVGAAGQLVRLFVLELPALATIVVGSIGMVTSAVDLASRWGASEAIVGLLVLATLTSLPNAYTAVRLGLAGRASALVSEALNSNTLNLFGGIILPALVVTLSVGRGSVLDLAALAGLTLGCLVLIGHRDGAGRAAGVAIVAAYVVYVATRLTFG